MYLLQQYRKNLIGIVVLAAVLLALGLGVTNDFYKTMLVFSMINGVAAVGLCLLFGFGGQISLGQSAFVGLGAYTTANLLQKLGVNPFLSLVASILLPAALGWLIARPILKLAGHYLAMGTLALGVIMFIFFSQMASLTGGVDPGIIDMPAFSLFGRVMNDTGSMFWVCAVALLLAMLVAVNLANSRVGRALRALKGAEVPASGLGVDTVGYKVAVFSVAAGLAGLSGSLYAFATRSFNAGVFDVPYAIDLLVMVVVGSVTTPWGALLGAFAVTILPSFLEGFDQYKTLVFGGVMTAVMVFMPDGLLQAAYDGLKSLGKRGK